MIARIRGFALLDQVGDWSASIEDPVVRVFENAEVPAIGHSFPPRRTGLWQGNRMAEIELKRECTSAASSTIIGARAAADSFRPVLPSRQLSHYRATSIHGPDLSRRIPNELTVGQTTSSGV